MSGRKTYINPYAKGNYIGMSTSQLGGSGSSNTATDGDGAAAAATLSTNRRTTRSSPKKNTTNDALTSCAGKSDDYNDVLLSGLAPSTKAGNDSAEKYRPTPYLPLLLHLLIWHTLKFKCNH